MFVDHLRCSCCRGLPASRGLPGGNSLFFCVAKKKVSKEKGDPMVWVPPLRYGQPPVLGKSGVWLNSPSAQTTPALIRFCLRSSAQPDGWGTKADAGIPDAQSASGRSQHTVMFARGRNTHGQMKLPAIAQRGEGGVGGGSGESLLLPRANRSRSVLPVIPGPGVPGRQRCNALSAAPHHPYRSCAQSTRSCSHPDQSQKQSRWCRL